MNMLKILVCLILLVPTQCLAAFRDSLRLSNALQSNMVVQQNKPFKIWGTAEPREQVIIHADWLPTSTNVYADTNGYFVGILPVPSAKKGDFTPHRIRVAAGNEQVELSNLLIGDVWICSGQSNMQFPVKEMLRAEEVISGADQPNIRLLNVALNFSET